jgi:hypothetical protein
VKQLYPKAFWILFVILLIACRKETNNSIPVINFVYPQGESPDFNRLGEQIIFSLTDDQLIRQARIGWVNEDFIPLNNPEWIEVNSLDTTLNYRLSATDIPSGKAYIQIRVDDGEHTKLKYQPVNVSEEQGLSQKIIFGFNEMQKGFLFGYDTTSVYPEKFLITPYPIKRIEGNAENDLLAMLSENLSFVEIWSGKDSIALWRQEASFPEPKFSDWYLDEHAILLSDFNGNLRLHHFRTGLTQVTTKLEAVYRISAVAFDQEYIYAAVRDMQTDRKWLYLFYKVSGTFYKRFELTYLPFDLIPVAHDHSLVMFAVDTQTTHLIHFNTITERFMLKNSLSNFKLTGPVVRQDDNYFLHDSRVIQLWSSVSNVTSLLAKGIHINGVATFNTGVFVFYLDDDVFEVVHPSPQYSGYTLHKPLTFITSSRE